MSEVQKIRNKSSFKSAKRRTFAANLEKHGQYTCEYCSRAPLFKNESGLSQMRNDLATIDHIIPISKGGLHSGNNLTVCCWECNLRKGND